MTRDEKELLRLLRLFASSRGYQLDEGPEAELLMPVTHPTNRTTILRISLMLLATKPEWSVSPRGEKSK